MKNGPQEDVLRYRYMKNEPFAQLLARLNRYFADFPQEATDFSKELNYLNQEWANETDEKKLLYAILPYPFTKKYAVDQIIVYKDEEAGMFYVLLEDKRLYYPRSFREEEAVRTHFLYLMIEQDVESPHCYLDENFQVNKEDVVLDLGAAEGNFALMIVEKVKRVIVVEGDPNWMEALEKTFQPWKDKVHFINKFVGGAVNDLTHTTLEHLEGIREVTAIKMDIEGAEWETLQAANALLRARQLKMAVTTYHHHGDAYLLETLLTRNGYKIFFSNKFMLFIYDDLDPPFFRKTLIKATNA